MVKSTFLSLILIVVTCVSSYSQLGRGFIGVSGGANLPGGNFDQQELLPGTYSGFAELDYSYSAFAGYMNNPYLGFIMEYKVHYNKFDHVGFYDLLTTNTDLITDASEKYKSEQYGVGLIAGLPNKQSMGIYAYGSIGLSMNSYPTFSRTEPGESGYTQTVWGSEESDIYYSFGLLIPINISDRFSLCIKAAYSASESQHTTSYYLDRKKQPDLEGNYTPDPIQLNYVRFEFSMGLIYKIFKEKKSKTQ